MFSPNSIALPQSRFGQRGGGGRRDSGRVETQLSALIRTLLTTRSVELTDVSATGAQLRGSEAPKAGENLFLRIGQSEMFAEVIWSQGEMFGVAFDDPISPRELSALRAEAQKTNLMRLSAEQREAWENWVASSR